MREPNIEFIRSVLDLSEVKSFEWDDAPVNIDELGASGLVVPRERLTVHWKAPIPVLADGKRIGFASLWRDTWDTGDVFADLFLVKECRQRLDLQENTRPMYLKVFDRHFFSGPSTNELTIQSLELTDVRPTPDAAPVR